MKFQKKSHLLRSVLIAACVAGSAMAAAWNANGKSYDSGVEGTGPVLAAPTLWRAKLQERVPERREAPAPRRADIDKDGVISRDEARGYYELLFSFLDGDRDGTITSGEFVQAFSGVAGNAAEQQALSERLARLFDTLDGDGDDELTVREFLNACDEHYDISDTDDDGRVSVREFRSRAM